MSAVPVRYKLFIMSPSSDHIDDAVFMVELSTPPAAFHPGAIIDTYLFHGGGDERMLKVTHVVHMMNVVAGSHLTQQIFVFTTDEVGDVRTTKQ